MKEKASHLSEILSRFGLKNKDLADMLNVHYSLVSKWLNNKRPIRYNSEHLRKLTEVLISLDGPNHLANLRMVLLDNYPEADLRAQGKS